MDRFGTNGLGYLVSEGYVDLVIVSGGVVQSSQIQQTLHTRATNYVYYILCRRSFAMNLGNTLLEFLDRKSTRLNSSHI